MALPRESDRPTFSGPPAQMRKAEQILRSWTDEQLSVAATELATYTSEGEQQIRSEGRRRGLPDPEGCTNPGFAVRRVTEEEPREAGSCRGDTAYDVDEMDDPCGGRADGVRGRQGQRPAEEAESGRVR